jgi:hypothetical protein
LYLDAAPEAVPIGHFERRILVIVENRKPHIRVKNSNLDFGLSPIYTDLHREDRIIAKSFSNWFRPPAPDAYGIFFPWLQQKAKCPGLPGAFCFLKSDFRLELVPEDADAASYSLSCTLILSHGLASNRLRDVIDRLQNA